MPQSVSVPEKTLEHWSSQYVTYRYRSKAALWWPTSREDIDVRWLPTRPGKAVQLELKTTTVAGAGLHDVLLDLGQLWEYRQRPLGHQPFYVFPWPNWSGSLVTEANARGRPVTELGYSRSGFWFADWMVVLTAAEVAGVLRNELTAHGSRKRGTKERLVRFDLRYSTSTPVITWGSGAVPPEPLRWRDFWTTLEECGRVAWPQLIRLPAQVLRTEGPYRRSQVAEMLRIVAAEVHEAADSPATDQKDDEPPSVAFEPYESGNDEPLVTLEPDEDGNYQIASTGLNNLNRVPDDEVDRIGNYRQVVFLGAEALVPRDS